MFYCKYFLSLFLIFSLVFSSVQVPQDKLQTYLAPTSIFVEEGFSPEELKPHRLFPLGALLLYLVSIFYSSCSLAPTRENIADLTHQIQESIRVREEGNSGEIVDWIDERRDLLERSGLSRGELAGGDALGLKGLAKEIYLEFGVVVEGARERDLMLLIGGKYVIPEVARLFQDNPTQAIELLFGNARPQNKEDLRSIVESKWDWVPYWQREEFQPVLNELRTRYQGISLREMIELVGRNSDGTESLEEEELLGLFLILNSDLENFVHSHGRWFLEFAQGDPSSEGDRALQLRMKLEILFKVSPECFDLLFRELTEEETSLFVKTFLWSNPLNRFHGVGNHEDLREGDTFSEVRILERIYQLLGESNLREEILEQMISMRDLLVWIKATPRGDLRTFLISYLFPIRDFLAIIILDRSQELRRSVSCARQVLNDEELIQKLSEVLEQIQDEGDRQVLNAIIEEVRSGSFEYSEEEGESDSDDVEQLEAEILEEWRRLRENWERQSGSKSSSEKLGAASISDSGFKFVESSL